MRKKEMKDTISPGLTFNVLRGANVKRLPEFKNSKGENTHNALGDNWLLSQWMNAVNGETGEAANLIKKYERGDLSKAELIPLLRKELADVVTYLDLLAYVAGIDLGEATINKFNEISDRVGSSVKILSSGQRFMSIKSDLPQNYALLRMKLDGWEPRGMHKDSLYICRPHPKHPDDLVQVLCNISAIPQLNTPFVFGSRGPDPQAIIGPYYSFHISALSDEEIFDIIDSSFNLNDYPTMHKYVKEERFDPVGVYNIEPNGVQV